MRPRTLSSFILSSPRTPVLQRAHHTRTRYLLHVWSIWQPWVDFPYVMYQRSKWLFPHFRFGHFRKVNPRPLFNTSIFLISAKYGLRNHFWPLENGFLMRKKSSRRNISTNAYILKSLSWSIGNITTYWEIVLGFFGLQSRCVVHLNSSEAVLVILESYCAFWGVDKQKVLDGLE